MADTIQIKGQIKGQNAGPINGTRWLALCDADGPFGPRSTNPPGADDLLGCGSLVAELMLASAPGSAGDLLHYASTQGWPRQLSLHLSADGCLSLLHRQGGSTAALSLALALPDKPVLLRLTYGWDAPRRTSRLTAELPALGLRCEAVGSNPLPLPMQDVLAMATGQSRLHPRLLWFGITAGIEPVGHPPGIAGHCLIGTPDGARRIDQLRPGDLVQTRDHGAQPVRWTGRSDMPARGSFAPVRLRAPYFGSRTDLILSSGQKVLLQGAEVEYLFGEDAVLAEARHLCDGRIAMADHRRTLMRYHSILLDHHAVLASDSYGLESLYLGPGRAPLPPETLIAALPRGLWPRHQPLALPVLRGFEAVTLTAMRQQAGNPLAA